MPLLQQHNSTDFEQLLAAMLRKRGWAVKNSSQLMDEGVDIVARHGKTTYVFELKVSSESRKDRAIPLLSQAILEVRTAAARISQQAKPVAVIAFPFASESLARHIEDFVLRNAPDVAVGIIDTNGFRRFTGHDLEVLNVNRPNLKPVRKEKAPSNLFSDLNQWMLKVLLSRSFPDSLLSAPRGHYHNASQLADAAKVSVMSAFRLVRQLSEDGFLEERQGLRLVRIEELLERWSRSNDYSSDEIPARWILKGDKNNLYPALRAYANTMRSGVLVKKHKHVSNVRPRICVSLFAAADSLGFKFVHGIEPHLYIERLDQQVLEDLGLSLEIAGHQPDVFLRVPKYPETVFRAAVERDGMLVSDILQVWLDVANHPARGKAQADILRKRVLSNLLRKEDA